MTLLFLILGAVAALGGGAMLAMALRHRRDPDAVRPTAMLIGGMMLLAFGLLLGGFALGYQLSEPLDLDTVVTP